ncbi:hypothetical protein AOG27_21065, partial [Pseudoalteromonas lipolytica]
VGVVSCVGIVVCPHAFSRSKLPVLLQVEVRAYGSVEPVLGGKMLIIAPFKVPNCYEVNKYW